MQRQGWGSAITKLLALSRAPSHFCGHTHQLACPPSWCPNGVLWYFQASLASVLPAFISEYLGSKAPCHGQVSPSAQRPKGSHYRVSPCPQRPEDSVICSQQRRFNNLAAKLFGNNRNSRSQIAGWEGWSGDLDTLTFGTDLGNRVKR